MMSDAALRITNEHKKPEHLANLSKPRLPYHEPALYALGSLEQVQSNAYGTYYDGPATEWLRD